MILFVYGDEPYLVQEAIANATKSALASNTQVASFGPEDSLATILIELGTMAMFSTSKLIIIRNHEALAVEAQAQKLLDELKRAQAEWTIVIAWEEKTPPRSSLTTWLAKNAEVHELNKVESKKMMTYIKDLVTKQNGQITNGAALQLANRLPNNLRIVANEINKLLAEQESITEAQVKASIGEYLKDEAFALTNALVTKDVYGIVSAYRTQKLHEFEPINTIAQIGSLLSLGLHVASLRAQGYTKQDIADRLKIHPFRVQKAQEMVSALTLEQVKNLSLQLAMLDQNIKRGKVEAELGLDGFILQAIR